MSYPVKVVISDDSGRQWVIPADRSWTMREVRMHLMEQSGYALEEQTLQLPALGPDGTLPVLDDLEALDLAYLLSPKPCKLDKFIFNPKPRP